MHRRWRGWDTDGPNERRRRPAGPVRARAAATAAYERSARGPPAGLRAAQLRVARNQLDRGDPEPRFRPDGPGGARGQAAHVAVPRHPDAVFAAGPVLVGPLRAQDAGAGRVAGRPGTAARRRPAGGVLSERAAGAP